MTVTMDSLSDSRHTLARLCLLDREGGGQNMEGRGSATGA